MTMFQMLAEMVRAIELLRIIALAELVHGGQMLEAMVPVWTGEIGELLAAVAACVVGGACAGLVLG